MRIPLSTLNRNLSRPGREVWIIEALSCAAGDLLEVTFESVHPRWRQGIWFGLHGQLQVAETVSAQLTLWQDTAPPVATLRILDTEDGLLRFYNVWDSGRGLRLESQMATTGMLREEDDDGLLRYRCSDIAPDPAFDALVFSVRRTEQAI